MQYEYLEHIADVKFRAYGKTKEELIENSGKALCNAVIDLKKVKKTGEEIIKIKAESFEEALFEFLKEVLYLIDSQEIIFREFKTETNQKEKKFFLKAKCFGEKIDLKKHQIKTEIKAITKHGFKAVKEKNKWTAEVLVDV